MLINGAPATFGDAFMPISLYQASIATLVHNLSSLAGLLRKAEADAEARKIEPSVFLNARIAPDMFPLIRQVQIASDTAKGAAARLAGAEIPSFPDTETSFAELAERIAKTIAFVQSVDKAAVEGAAERRITLNFPGRDIHFTGESYLLSFVMPNLYFHMTTAYAILRHNGVAVGKMDFLGVS